MQLTYRGQTYTTSNQPTSIDPQATLSYRGQSYQPCCSPCIVSPKASLVYRGVPYEEDYSNATEIARMFGFFDHQIALSCPLEG
jgi:hypothetical protein